MDYEKIGKFISERRKNLNLTQKQLAIKLKITDKAVSKWERGLGCPDVSILGELSEALGVGIGEILKGEIDVNLRDNNAMIKDVVLNTNKETKNKIYISISKMLSIIMIIISAYLIFMSVKQVIFLNSYTTTDLNIKSKIDENYNNIKNKIKIINNLGMFTDEEKDKLNQYTDFTLSISVENNILYTYQSNEKFYYTDYDDTSLRLDILNNLPTSILKIFENYDNLKFTYNLTKDDINSIIKSKDDTLNVAVLYQSRNYTSDVYLYSSINNEKINLDNALNYFNDGLENVNLVLDKIIEIGENNE